MKKQTTSAKSGRNLTLAKRTISNLGIAEMDQRIGGNNGNLAKGPKFTQRHMCTSF